MLEILDRPFMLLGGFQRIESSEISAAMGLWIDLPGIDPVLPAF